MCHNLLKSGHDVVAFDINKTALAEAVTRGARRATTCAEVSENASTIITMLPANAHVREAYFGTNGVLAPLIEGHGERSLLIDCSTCEPVVAQEVFAGAEKCGAIFHDAPVSGGTIGARDATLSFMVGGSEDNFPVVETLLAHMGKNITYCGKAGMGQVAKLCNNLVLAISMAGVAEAHALGGRLGLDQKVFADIINSSSGRCWSSDTYNPCPGVMEGVPSARGYTGGFACDLMVKDLGLAMSAAGSAQPKVSLPMGGLASSLYTLLSTTGAGHKDFSAIYELVASVK